MSAKWWLHLFRGIKKPRHILERILFPLPCILLTCWKGVPYPLYRDYCDFLVLSGMDMEKLVHYFGVFAAMRLFVEEAIPTAMKLVCTNIKTEADISYHGVEYWTENDKKAFYNRFSGSLNKMITEWDSDVLYYHPVKLSKWN